jgi:soluble lytic murein transglycosylase
MTPRRIYSFLLFGIFFLTSACSISAPVTLRLTPTPTQINTPQPSFTSTPEIIPTTTFTPSPTPVPIARVESGDYALEIGDYDRAIDEFQVAQNSAQDDETRAAALLGIGRAYYLKKNNPAALDAYRGVLNMPADKAQQAEAYYYLGKIYQSLNRNGEAAEMFSAYLENQPGVLDAFIGELRGDALAGGGDYPGAVDSYQTARLAPRLGDAFSLDLKIARSLAISGDYTTALDQYNQLFNNTTNEYTKAQLDLLMGQAYIALNQPDEAFDRFLDAVTNYPRAYDSYSALVALVEAGVQVNDLYRGVVDYFAGQYGPALVALDRFMANNPDHDGTAIHYKALTLRALKEHWAAIYHWDTLINNYPNDRFWTSAWEEKAFTLWAYLGEYNQAAQTSIDFVAAAPADLKAPDLLFQAARNLERANRLEDAAVVWEKLADDYMSSEYTFQALFLAGVSRYRQENWPVAKTNFQRALLLSSDPGNQAAALLWIGKVNLKNNDPDAAALAWQQAANRDPTGYYSERARDLLANRQPFTPPEVIDLSFDVVKERLEAETWLRSHFPSTHRDRSLWIGKSDIRLTDDPWQ